MTALAEIGYPVRKRWSENDQRHVMVGPRVPDGVLARARALTFDRLGYQFSWEFDPEEYRR